MHKEKDMKNCLPHPILVTTMLKDNGVLRNGQSGMPTGNHDGGKTVMMKILATMVLTSTLRRPFNGISLNLTM